MIRLALPTGDLRESVGRLLESAGLDVRDYASGSRSYVLSSQGNGGIQMRVFREKDIPIQVALGNYDLGVCRIEWVEDLTQRYPTNAIVPLRDLGVGRRSLFVATAPGNGVDVRDWAQLEGLRIVSEYANIAEAFAMGLRLADYRVFPVWGTAEAYPPEDADIALISAVDEEEVLRLGLLPLHSLLESSVWVVANRRSLDERGLRPLLASPLLAGAAPDGRPALNLPLAPAAALRRARNASNSDDIVRLALPDGHQQRHAVAALEAAGLSFEGYGVGECVARPDSGMPGLSLKVIRPQDMPQQVALGHFDLAIAGRDWLLDHLYRFPGSPVEEAVDLGLGRYAVAAVVTADMPASSLEDALGLWQREGKSTIRIASEYVNIADDCARAHHLPRYKVIPIGGASEGFVPEDAELLVEGTETGATLAANNLKAIDVLLESTACVIKHRGEVARKKRPLLDDLLARFRRAAAREA